MLDENATMIVEIIQLNNAVKHERGAQLTEVQDKLEKRRKKLNRNLMTLAKWADESTEPPVKSKPPNTTTTNATTSEKEEKMEETATSTGSTNQEAAEDALKKEDGRDEMKRAEVAGEGTINEKDNHEVAVKEDDRIVASVGETEATVVPIKEKVQPNDRMEEEDETDHASSSLLHEHAGLPQKVEDEKHEHEDNEQKEAVP
jgi:hypothetical protein